MEFACCIVTYFFLFFLIFFFLSFFLSFFLFFLSLSSSSSSSSSLLLLLLLFLWWNDRWRCGMDYCYGMAHLINHGAKTKQKKYKYKTKMTRRWMLLLATSILLQDGTTVAAAAAAVSMAVSEVMTTRTMTRWTLSTPATRSWTQSSFRQHLAMWNRWSSPRGSSRCDGRSRWSPAGILSAIPSSIGRMGRKGIGTWRLPVEFSGIETEERMC